MQPAFIPDIIDCDIISDSFQVVSLVFEIN